MKLNLPSGIFGHIPLAADRSSEEFKLVFWWETLSLVGSVTPAEVLPPNPLGWVGGGGGKGWLKFRSPPKNSETQRIKDRKRVSCENPDPER